MERPVESAVDRKFENEETGKRIEKIVSMLTPRELSIFIVRATQECTVEETAQLLGVSQENISMIIKKMRVKARKVFGESKMETRQIKRGRK